VDERGSEPLDEKSNNIDVWSLNADIPLNARDIQCQLMFILWLLHTLRQLCEVALGDQVERVVDLH
jgi:hypothetical protein